jgi:hypothetical protein
MNGSMNGTIIHATALSMDGRLPQIGHNRPYEGEAAAESPVPMPTLWSPKMTHIYKSPGSRDLSSRSVS